MGKIPPKPDQKPTSEEKPRKREVIASPKEYENAHPEAKEYAISDGKCPGLQMIVSPSGSKQWEFRYRLSGHRRKISIQGGYPKNSVKVARDWATYWTDLVSKGIDPADDRRRKQEEAAAKRGQGVHTFRSVASTWLDIYARTKPLSPISRKHIQEKFDNDVFPVFGDKSVSEVTESDIDRLTGQIVGKGRIDKAYRVLWHCRGVFGYAVEKGLASKDPTFNKEKRLPPLKTGNRAALTDPQQVGKLLRDIAGCGAAISTRGALRLVPLVFTRPSELRLAKWSEIDLERALWDIPAQRMKGPVNKRRSHLVPLSRQAVAILRELRETNEESEYVFPSPRSPHFPLSNMAQLKALRAMGYTSKDQSIHGFRAIARTLLDERLRFPAHVIEAQLAHAVKDSNGTAYNRTQHIDARREMMQAWADYLDTLERGEG
ncbi:MAG: integrase arm-type DNA-binding domain-containing protein [Fibrobacteres bacterium]|nr:integrase arm-type DNA-binding domain-containing protein [Fibrobacterota bacterium]